MFTKAETNKVKGIAICLLIFHHMYRTVNDIQARGVMLHLVTGDTVSQIAFCFRICVYIFVILTAYGVTLSYMDRQKDGIGTLSFLVERYIKLLAPFWFTLTLLYVVYAIVPGLQPFTCYQGNYKYVLGEYFALLDLVGKSNVMFSGVFWYMNFAVIEIVAIPVIYFLAKKIGWALPMITSVFWGFIPRVFCSIYGGDYTWYIFAIEIGVLAACYHPLEGIQEIYERCSKLQRGLIAVVLLFAAGIFPYIAWFKIQFDYFGLRPICHTLGAVSVILFSFLTIKWKTLSRLFMILGKYSADMFLIHTIVFKKLEFIVCMSSHIIVQFLVCVLLCLTLSFLISLLKKYTGYNRLTEQFVNWIDCLRVQGRH